MEGKYSSSYDLTNPFLKIVKKVNDVGWKLVDIVNLGTKAPNEEKVGLMEIVRFLDLVEEGNDGCLVFKCKLICNFIRDGRI